MKPLPTGHDLTPEFFEKFDNPTNNASLLKIMEACGVPIASNSLIMPRNMSRKKNLPKEEVDDEVDFSVDGGERGEEDDALMQAIVPGMSRMKMSTNENTFPLKIGVQNLMNMEVTTGFTRTTDDGTKKHRVLHIRFPITSIKDESLYKFKILQTPCSETADGGFKKLLFTYPLASHAHKDDLDKYLTGHEMDIEDENENNPVFEDDKGKALFLVDNCNRRTHMNSSSMSSYNYDKQPSTVEAVLLLPRDPESGKQIAIQNTQWQGEAWDDKLSEDDGSIKVRVQPVPFNDSDANGDRFQGLRFWAGVELAIVGNEIIVEDKKTTPKKIKSKKQKSERLLRQNNGME